MKKVLIISYYWPPSGGAGVQRWLKLSSSLANLGVEVHVLTVDENKASYMQWDETLFDDVHPDVMVYKTNSFEPINYYAKLVGKKNVPTAGFSNVDNSNWKQKLVNSARSNFFIPDPRIGWKKYAVKKAKELIKLHDIPTVITTSPPHSTQLIGLKLKAKFPTIKWVVDFRDPWTDIYYYELLGHTALSKKLDSKYEKQVINKSDQIITVGEKFADSFKSKTKKDISAKIAVIPNGYDPKDFDITCEQNERFTISYTGTMSDYYQPEVFFEALAELISKYSSEAIDFVFIGSLSANLKKFISDKIGNHAAFLAPVTHKEIIKYMIKSHVLLLVTQGTEGTIPGKTFEYLAAKRTIICIGKGDAAEAIKKCNAGESFNRDEKDKITAYLETCYQAFKSEIKQETNDSEIEKLSRPYQAKQVYKLL